MGMGVTVFMLKLTCLLEDEDGGWVFSVKSMVGFAGCDGGAGGSGGPMVTPAGGGGFPWQMAALQPATKSLWV